MPGEHGGLILVGATVPVAAALAPQPALAAAASLVYVLAYLLRGPVERAARGFRPRRWDRAVGVSYVALAAAALATVAAQRPHAALLVGVTAALIPVTGAILSRQRAHRALAAEMLGLGACAGAAGMGVLAGGAGVAVALPVALAMGSYGLAVAPLVRPEVRARRGEVSGPGLALLAAGLLLLGAGATALAAAPLCAAAFCPRTVRALVVAWRGPARHRIGVVALRETGELALFGLLLFVTLSA